MNTLVYRRGFTPTLLAMLTLIFFGRVWFAPAEHALISSDLVQIHYPLLQFMVRSIQQGIIPLWNPHQFLGYSVVGNPQYGLFYPPNWLLVIFGEDHLYRGIGFLLGIHFFWAAWGMASLTRRYGAHPLPAMIAGAIFGLGGFFAVRLYAGHYALILSAAWLPWLWSYYLASVGTPHRFLWVSGAGVALAMTMLAGHPQMVYFGGLGLGLMWLSLVLNAPRRQSVWLASRHLIALVGIGACLSAVIWLPTFHYSGQTQRGNETSLEFANQHAIPLEQFTTLLVPGLYGEPFADEGYRGQPFYEEMTTYAGLLPILCLFLLPFLHRSQTLFFVLLIGVGLILSLGMEGGLYRLLYELIPPVRNFRAPGRALLFVSVGLSGTIALGLTHLMSMEISQRIKACRVVLIPTILGIVIAGAFALKILSPLSNWTSPGQPSAQLVQDHFTDVVILLMAILIGISLMLSKNHFIRQAGIGLLLLIPLIDVGMMAWPHIMVEEHEISKVWQMTPSMISSESLGRVQQLPPPVGIINGASAVDVYSAQGYDPISPLDWSKMVEAAGQFIVEPGSAVNRIFGVEYAVSGRPIEDIGLITGQFMVLIGEQDGLYFYQNPSPLPRAYLSYAYAVQSDDEVVRQRVTDGEVDQGQLVLLNEKPDCLLSDNAEPDENARLDIVQYTPNYIEIEVETTNSALLVLSDQFDPDWQANINGKQTNIYKANAIVRAVCIPAGKSTITFRYRPISFFLGGVVSILGWLGMSIGLVLSTRRKLELS